MLDSIYRRRIQRDLPGWVARGWVRPESVDPLLASLPGRDLRERLPAIVAMFGAILLALGAMSFVAANWAGLSRVLRLGLLFGALWACFGGAIWLRARGWTVLHEAAIVLACGIFGANIMLIAQMYHIDRHYPDGIMIWGLGTLFAAGLSRSVAAVVFGFALLALWTMVETMEFEHALHWPFLVAWFATAWLVWYERWTLAVNAAALALFAWITVTAFGLDAHYRWASDAAAPCILALSAIAGLALAVRFEAKLERRDGATWRMFTTQALILLFGTILVLQFALDGGTRAIAAPAGATWLAARLEIIAPLAAAAVAIAAIALAAIRADLPRRDAAVLAAAVAAVVGATLVGHRETAATVIVAATAFGLAVWAVNLGQRRDHAGAFNVGFAAFGIEALYVYFRTIGSLLDTALFFAAGGVALVALALVLEKVRRRLVAGDGARGRSQPA